MSELFALLVPALGATLLHFLWQGALIGAIAALALWVLRGAPPQARYLVACLALVACAVVPLVTFALHVAALASAGSAAAPLTITLAEARTQPLAAMAGTAVASIGRMESALPWIVLLWASGAGTGLLRMAWGLSWIRRLRPTAAVALQAAWQQRLDALAVHFALGRRVALRIVDRLDSPAAIGWFRPVVLLPAAVIAHLPADLVEALLAHELAHVRRHDYLVNLVQTAVEALLFYHPVVWALSRCIRRERERIADRLAAEIATPPRKLARALSALAELRADAPLPHLALAAQGGPLMSRIQQLIQPRGPARSGAAIAVSLAGLVVACVASFSYANAGQRADAGEHSSSVHVVDDGDDREAFAIIDSTRDDITLWGSMDTLKAIRAIKATRGAPAGTYLWIRRDGKDLIVTDPAVIAKAREAWHASDAIDARMEALDAQMERHSDAMEALGEQMEELSRNAEPSADFEAAQRESEQLARQEEQIARQEDALARKQEELEDSDSPQARQLEQQREALEEKRDALDAQRERLDERMDAESARMETTHSAPMEALSRRMEEASTPMEALGAQMEALSAEHEKAEAAAENQLRRIVDDAIARGLARPAG
jgi:beta-lactamase regulating signal transducer with metallopeptidase domain